MRSVEVLERENKLLRQKLAIALKAVDAFVAMAKWVNKSTDDMQNIRRDVQDLNATKAQG